MGSIGDVTYPKILALEVQRDKERFLEVNILMKYTPRVEENEVLRDRYSILFEKKEREKITRKDGNSATFSLCVRWLRPRASE